MEVSDLLEPCEGRLSSTVLRGEGRSDTTLLPEPFPTSPATHTCSTRARSLPDHNMSSPAVIDKIAIKPYLEILDASGATLFVARQVLT